MKQQLSIAYIRMLIAAAGCTAASFSADYDGVDVGVKSHAEYSYKLGPTLDIQLKCTSKKDAISNGYLSWSIDRRTHKYLTSPKRSCPAILAVLVVPRDHNGWLDHDEQRLLTESIMYWISGADIPAIPEGQQSLTVKMSINNRLTRESLLGVMHLIGEGSPGWRIPAL
ncbi:DUF4365 domain-containing protein [Mycobacteroides abscessus]|jgi:hypothetical protein|uniref:DUF4365 domain-containing protein n=1 Tax=Mycobacteroides abscessus TaxID=36809 RepID=UPI000695FDE6|nr:DUF4365 domain-containing protein [Mycobacteroides abscessus subsp. abscessus]OTR20707.1 hypothetical protein B9M80_09020 [Mycobacteroides abscessus]MBN7328443.1 DUF4365 domain-containing protein [Mycobacteroides abscessus subsp. abscessus]MBN7329632.1 DUF4365 domain-containing protein [Mycobacteroides abscessus subsp. abscessus]MBN7463001.1 DUF4365 domain-containing protein [Mycobacteroides abscessus subsp. abscessus]